MRPLAFLISTYNSPPCSMPQTTPEYEHAYAPQHISNAKLSYHTVDLQLKTKHSGLGSVCLLIHAIVMTL